MRQIAALFFIALSFAACKKTTIPVVDNSKPLTERIPGEWRITAVDYTGVIVNPNNPNLSIPISGSGQNVTGFFKFVSNPNEGDFSVSFLASINIGTSQPLTVPVSESHDGEWSVNADNNIVTMWRNDSIYDWKVLENLENQQQWQARFYLDFGAPYDSVPVNVKATMTRK